VSVFGDKYVKNKEYIYQNTKHLTKYSGKSLMIIGAGPSTLETEWWKIKTDYVWSCNHFFLHPRLAKTQVDLFGISNELRINKNQDLKAYMKRFPSSTAYFETTSRPVPQIMKFNAKFPNRSCYAHTRYRSKIGAMPRLLCLATFLGASKIYFVGMDGLPTRTTVHAFQPGKKLKGASIREDAPNIFRRQYVTFWDYMLNMVKSSTQFVNLGEGVAGNLSTDISREHFSLKAGV
jgi:hypothetical protein